jgi:fructose-1,6-bisphosphatase
MSSSTFSDEDRSRAVTAVETVQRLEAEQKMALAERRAAFRALRAHRATLQQISDLAGISLSRTGKILNGNIPLKAQRTSL